jgi:hypothetical protein
VEYSDASHCIRAIERISLNAAAGMQLALVRVLPQQLAQCSQTPQASCLARVSGFVCRDMDAGKIQDRCRHAEGPGAGSQVAQNPKIWLPSVTEPRSLSRSMDGLAGDPTAV